MRRRDEFATWLAARWPALVRTLVFLGHPQPEAERVARRGGRPDAPRLGPGAPRRRRRRPGLPGAARGARAGAAARAATRPAPAPDEPDLPPGLADRLERRRELEAYLATLPEPERVRTVLVHVAGLAEDEVDDVTGQPGVTPAAADGRPPTCATPARRSRRRRPRSPACWRARAAGGVRPGPAARRSPRVVAVVLAATTWWTSGDDDQPDAGRGHAGDEPAARPVVRRRHAAPGPTSTCEVAGARQLLAVPDGVVYSDAEGHVVHVDDAGRQRTIGETVAGSPARGRAGQRLGRVGRPRRRRPRAGRPRHPGAARGRAALARRAGRRRWPAGRRRPARSRSTTSGSSTAPRTATSPGSR